jgi:flagellar protein FlaG
MKGKSKRQIEVGERPAKASQLTVSQVNAPEYREGYANSVEVKLSVWDFRLKFGRTAQTADNLTVNVFQAIDLSPQQAKAVWNLLGQHLAQYEQTFGPINLQQVSAPAAEQPVGAGSTRPQ